MDYQETLEYINKSVWRGSIPGLSRVGELLNLIGNPQKKLKFIHIGGTNGKGSTAEFLSSILVTAGFKTGLYISPYIEDFNERMQIDNQNISNDELAEIATFIRPFAESMEDTPTEFELYTAIAMEYFARHECDIVVLEVGTVHLDRPRHLRQKAHRHFACPRRIEDAHEIGRKHVVVGKRIADVAVVALAHRERVEEVLRRRTRAEYVAEKRRVGVLLLHFPVDALQKFMV